MVKLFFVDFELLGTPKRELYEEGYHFTKKCRLPQIRNMYVVVLAGWRSESGELKALSMLRALLALSVTPSQVLSFSRYNLAYTKPRTGFHSVELYHKHGRASHLLHA